VASTRMGCGVSSYSPVEERNAPVPMLPIAPAGAYPASLESGYGAPLARGQIKKSVVKYPDCWSWSCWPFWICCLTTTLLSLVVILVMQQLNMGRVVSMDEGVAIVHIGGTMESNSDFKCVEAPPNVLCDDTAERLGVEDWTDKFHVYHDGLGKVCAKRVDWPKPWSVDLSLKCKVVDNDEEAETVHVVIGHPVGSHNSTKCVQAPYKVVCDNSSPQIGRTGEWKDTFDIYHTDGQICAHRTDAPTSWGLNLVLQCRTGGNAREVTFTDIHIGNSLNSHANVKCVDDPGHVVCDNAAQQIGRDGRYKDKFNIYQSDHQICAQRIDADDPWGLDLVLKCRNV